jgi:hypothetical protein
MTIERVTDQASLWLVQDGRPRISGRHSKRMLRSCFSDLSDKMRSGRMVRRGPK